MKDIIQSLPRIKEHHIRDNYVPDNPDNYSSYIHDNMKEKVLIIINDGGSMFFFI